MLPSMETNQRKARSSNFTIKEKALLVTLIKKYEDTIENKKNDKVGTTAKHKAWYYLTREFNASSGGAPRTQDTLQMCWSNLKKTIRRALSGNAARTNTLKCIEEQVLEVLGVSRKGLLNNHNDSNGNDNIDTVIFEEQSLSSNSFTKNLCKKNTSLPIVEECFSLQTHGASEEAKLEGSEENHTIPVNGHDPLSDDQPEEASSTIAENSSTWCEWIPLTLKQPQLSPLQNIESSTQQRERSDTRRSDVIEMMKQQMKEEIEFRREEAQHKRELFKIQKQQELVKLKILQKALQSANVTISMSGTTIHAGEK